MPGTWTSLNVKGKWLISPLIHFFFPRLTLIPLSRQSVCVAPRGRLPRGQISLFTFSVPLQLFVQPAQWDGGSLADIYLHGYGVCSQNGKWVFLLQGKSLERSIFSLVSFGKEMERGQKENSFDFDVHPNCCWRIGFAEAPRSLNDLTSCFQCVCAQIMFLWCSMELL